jgi:hypothetical protein
MQLKRLSVRMMMLCVVALASGCATQQGGSYCAAAQRPFQWRSDAEIDATPIRVLRYVEIEAETWAGLCRIERRARKEFKQEYFASPDGRRLRAPDLGRAAGR